MSQVKSKMNVTQQASFCPSTSMKITTKCLLSSDFVILEFFTVGFLAKFSDQSSFEKRLFTHQLQQ